MYNASASKPEIWTEHPASQRNRRANICQRRPLGPAHPQGPTVDRARGASSIRQCLGSTRPTSRAVAARRLHDLETDSVEPEVSRSYSAHRPASRPARA